ncbi:bifunctional cobalt-precorrin-7 (C(5))-methyltransferase/cobalt-precorrin-6B (C(15))-methyltransferase [Maridesulfovibrio hydrothermalis]|uniref:Precorrin-6y C5,15-methyltransferase (Decarboxylating), CbiE subunit n=1 Tax=Maridesulfovibrio hydrothermalis AM13 = DSM 14728 TaxID=1121451 RepID=L0RAZ4_9BACT|nr:bifunctional cobalt-precorrin-7 (C(5))-methyltransferase/cobalt-precorrin-6B (C(15))-methyltransferase [Maridesulfovibrio hydrothermalis]CCO22756.1 Precorrin-6y C5,15-methyltransferase (Decarboxylating), CbiE subunit [Maridesulfovibrio hydrothermalis AM13 = DSM 14728]
MKHLLQIIGLTPGSLEPPASAVEIIFQADILTGGKRLLDSFPDFKGEKLAFISPVTDYAEKLNKLLKDDKKIVLLADGDPLLFGVAESLAQLICADHVEIIPAPSTVQFAAARLGRSWKEFEIISLHGRTDYSPLWGAMQQEQSCAVYTDKNNSPAVIAKTLLDKGIDNYEMTVLAELNTESETITQGSLESFCESDCPALNLVLLTTLKTTDRQIFGRDDDSFIRQKGLITKFPVRATGIALLDLRPNQTVWDLGGGCGSVAIEASFIGHSSKFYAVEKSAERLQMIEKNIRRFRAWTVTAVHGTMPEALKDLPDPDRIFIGGGIGRDDSVIKEAAQRLKAGGRIVIHTILIGSFERTRRVFESLGWEWQSMQIQASTSDKLAGDVRYKAQNPVTIIWADKPEGH